MMMATQKLAAGLAAGCTFVLKPPEQTPLTCLELPKILEEAGLPAGVIHVLTGFGETAGAPLVEHRGVDKICFTGSKEVGKIIMRSGADTLKRVTLELGGKSPNIVFADSDLPSAFEGTSNGVFWNQGEICSAGTRVFVDRSVYDDAVNAFVDRAMAIRLGDGLDEETTMGPLISLEQKDRVSRYIEIGTSEAKLAGPGSPPPCGRPTSRRRCAPRRPFAPASCGSTTRSRRRPRCHGAATSSRASAASSARRVSRTSSRRSPST